MTTVGAAAEGAAAALTALYVQAFPKRGLLKPRMSARLRVVVYVPDADGCRFNSTHDWRERRLARLPPHPWLGASATSVGPDGGGTGLK